MPAISTPSRRRTITLRDGARVMLRPISPEDKRLLTASFARLSAESRYRRFFTIKDKLSAAELDYFVDVDHHDHEAIIAIDPSNGDLLGVARYIRSNHEADVAEVAVTVADDWQKRGLGRALLDRLTYRARRQGIRKFSALVQSDNPASLGLLESVGDTQRRLDANLVELVIELPPSRGIGARLTRALRAAAAGSLIPAHTLTHRSRRRVRMHIEDKDLVATLSQQVEGAPLAAAVYARVETALSPARWLGPLRNYLVARPAARAAAHRETERTDLPLDAAIVFGVAPQQLHVWAADPMTSQVHDHLGTVPLERISEIRAEVGKDWWPLTIALADGESLELTARGDVRGFVSAFEEHREPTGL